VEENINEEMSQLLYHFWIVKEDNPDQYYQIKYNQNKIREFVTKNLGSNLIIHNRFIKLEKIPSQLHPNQGLPNFTTQLDYVLLTVFLLYLEDKTRGDIFFLSDIVEYIKNTTLTLELTHVPDWNLISHRRSLLTVLNFLKELSVIKVRDEEKISFLDNKNAEGLYEITGISNYVMRLFDQDITTLTSKEELLKTEFSSQDEERGDIRRYKVFRNLLYTPASYPLEMTPSEVDYLKKNRSYIKNELSKKLDMEVEITHNMALIYDDNNSQLKDNFPNNKKITDIVLMINTEILKDMDSDKLTLDSTETVEVNKSYLEQIIKRVKEEKTVYIGKTYEKYTLEKFYQEVLTYMQDYNFISIKKDKIILYPMLSRMIGITKDIKKENIYQEKIDLFGGSDE
jgi:TIGR02678 family protein